TPNVTRASPTARVATPTETPPAPVVGTWRSTGSMSTPRWQFTATRLSDGHVLVVGGLGTADEDAPGAVALASAELFDPTTGTWTQTGSLHSPRARHTATWL